MKLLILLLILSVTTAFAQTGDALIQLKASAQAGDPAAQDKQAEKYILRADLKDAELWYRKAAAQGYAHAQGKLADQLLNRARMSVGLKPAVKMATGDEGVKWAVLAAIEGVEAPQTLTLD